MSEPRLPDLARSFERHLRAENKSDRTVETYLEAVRLSAWPGSISFAQVSVPFIKL